VTIRVGGALSAPAAREIADISRVAIAVVSAAQADISSRVAIASSWRARLHVRARGDARVRDVGQADLARLAFARDVALHTAIEREIAYRQDSIRAVGIAYACNADARGGIAERAMQAKSAVALVTALAERNTLVAAVGRGVDHAVSTRVASIRAEEPIRVELILREGHRVKTERGIHRRVLVEPYLRVGPYLRVRCARLVVVEAQDLGVAAADDRDDDEERAPPVHGAAEIIPSASSREAPLGYSARY